MLRLGLRSSLGHIFSVGPGPGLRLFLGVGLYRRLGLGSDVNAAMRRIQRTNVRFRSKHRSQFYWFRTWRLGLVRTWSWDSPLSTAWLSSRYSSRNWL